MEDISNQKEINDNCDSLSLSESSSESLEKEFGFVEKDWHDCFLNSFEKLVSEAKVFELSNKIALINQFFVFYLQFCIENVPISDQKRPKMFDKQNVFLLKKQWLKGPEADGLNCQWYNYALVLNGELLLENFEHLPETKRVFENALKRNDFKLIVAGFSWLKGKSRIEKHRDFNSDASPWHLPLILGTDGATLSVENQPPLKLQLKQFITFDDCQYHSASNDSNTDRLILYMVVGH